MNILYDEANNKTEVFEFTINQGGDLKLKVSNGSDRKITITFIDNKFDSVKHDLHKFDPRSDWYVYGAIADKIKEIEERYKAPQPCGFREVKSEI